MWWPPSVVRHWPLWVATARRPTSCWMPCGQPGCSRPMSASWCAGCCTPKRSPAEITRVAVARVDLVPMLGRVLRQPPPLADVLLDGAWDRFPDRLEPLAAAARVAPRLPLARALIWSARLRQRGLAASCPLVAIGLDGQVDPVVRVRAAAALHGSFREPIAVDMARAALDDLDPGARFASEEEIGRLAPGLRSALDGGATPGRPRARQRHRFPGPRQPTAPAIDRRSGAVGPGPYHCRFESAPHRTRPRSRRDAEHQARRPEYRRPVRGDQRRSRRGPPDGQRTPPGRRADLDDVLQP